MNPMPTPILAPCDCPRPMPPLPPPPRPHARPEPFMPGLVAPPRENFAEWMRKTLAAKADKVEGAAEGNLAVLDAGGNLADSGKAPSDFATREEVAGKQDAIADLDDIRSGAAAGSTAVQPAAIAGFVDGAEYDAEYGDPAKPTILLKHGQAVVATVPAEDFVIDGMVSDVKIENGNLVITFNTDSGKQPISIPLTDIFNPANYYDKTAADGRFVNKTASGGDTMAGRLKAPGFVNNHSATASDPVVSNSTLYGRNQINRAVGNNLYAYTLPDKSGTVAMKDDVPAGVVRYDAAQTLSDAQAAQARSNIKATLSERGPNHDGFSAWDVQPVYPAGYTAYVGPTWVDAQSMWMINFTGHPSYPDVAEQAAGYPDRDSLSLEFPSGTTATRTALPGYQLGSDDQHILASEAEAEALRSAVAAKYAKPSGGIPKSDLASAVQASLGKADTALQSHQQLAGVYGEPIAAKWTYSGDGLPSGTTVSLVYSTEGGTPHFNVNVLPDVWYVDHPEFPAEITQATFTFSLVEDGEEYTITATRVPVAYQLGTQFTRHLATAAQGAKADSAVQPADLAAKLDSTSAAPAFSSDSSTQYAVGSHCTYNGKLYKCTTATTGGTWVAGSWTVDTMTDPDAVLDITSQNQLRVVAKDGTLLWAQGYDLASTSSATLACDAANNFTFADGATTQAFALPTAPSGKVGDFGLDIDNSANTSAATMTLTGLDSTFSVVVPEGESLTDMLSIAAGELARFYITLSTFRVNNLPTWHIVKQVVENGGATA